MNGDVLLDPLDEARIRQAHREMLATVRSLVADFEGGPPAGGHEAWLAAARAVVAFLRQGVPAVARWEESCYRPASPTAEDTGFEHAFLAAEGETLAAAIARLPRDPRAAAASGAALAEVWRRLARLEAVLELHVLKAEDRSATLAAVPAAAAVPAVVARGATAQPQAGSAPPLQRMSAAEADALLRASGWAMLATCGDGRPYTVPVAYGYDGRILYFACTRGRKLSNLQRDSRVCLTVAEIRDGEHWRSVIAEGIAEVVTATAARAAALRWIGMQRAAAGQAAASDPRRSRAARVFRVVPQTVSGRSRGGASG